MNWKSLFDFSTTNTWIIALSIVANVFWSFFVLIAAFYFLDMDEGLANRMQIGLLLAEFLGPLIIGWFCGFLAFDDRGPTYGLVGALGSVLMIFITLAASGAIVIILSIAALAGGFNGGVFSRYRGKSQ